MGVDIHINFTGLVVGLASFCIIGIFHPVVIKAEYHFGIKSWPLFLVGGVICAAVSLFVASEMWSSLCAVLGFSFLWSIPELFEQRKRVEKGWFPKNPRKAKTATAQDKEQE
ncbi:MAG: DUF4491 family protein [Actinomycetes bacterium]|jgi:hypothetical protein|nr:DUF4491 family protein [Actinomycetes bacterium]